MSTNCAPLVADLFLFCYERFHVVSLAIIKLMLLAVHLTEKRKFPPFTFPWKLPSENSTPSYCKFGNFREDFIFAKLRICEVS